VAGDDDDGQRKQLVIGGQRFRIRDVSSEASRGAPTTTAGQAALAAITRGAGIANVITVRTLAKFEEVFLRASKGNDLYFILAKAEAAAGDVPAAALDSKENKYLFVALSEDEETICGQSKEQAHHSLCRSFALLVVSKFVPV